jgi:hypothetical protein
MKNIRGKKQICKRCEDEFDKEYGVNQITRSSNGKPISLGLPVTICPLSIVKDTVDRKVDYE